MMPIQPRKASTKPKSCSPPLAMSARSRDGGSAGGRAAPRGRRGRCEECERSQPAPRTPLRPARRPAHLLKPLKGRPLAAPPRGVFRGGTRPPPASPSSAVKPGEPPWLLPLLAPTHPLLTGAQSRGGRRYPQGEGGSKMPSPGGGPLLQGFGPTQSPWGPPSPFLLSLEKRLVGLSFLYPQRACQGMLWHLGGFGTSKACSICACGSPRF